MQHSQSTKDKMKALSELGFSSREIAKLVLGSETKKSTVNNILKQLDKQRIAKFDKEYDELDDETKEMIARTVQNSRNFWKAFEESCSKPKKDAEDNSRILFISDLHIPFHHEDSFDFLRHLKQKYKPTRVICLGDELDKNSLSYHEKNPDLYSPGHELQVSIPFIHELESIFPKMDILESNHGSLVWRKAQSSGIPKHYIKSYQDVLGVGDGWKWRFDMVIDLPDGSQCYVHHGKTSDIVKLSQTMSMHAVSGHFHEKFKIDFWANPQGLYWGMSVGCLIDDNALAFNYNNVNLKRPLIGTGLVIDSIPVLEPMILLPDGRWKGP